MYFSISLSPPLMRDLLLYLQVFLPLTEKKSFCTRHSTPWWLLHLGQLTHHQWVILARASLIVLAKFLANDTECKCRPDLNKDIDELPRTDPLVELREYFKSVSAFLLCLNSLPFRLGSKHTLMDHYILWREWITLTFAYNARAICVKRIPVLRDHVFKLIQLSMALHGKPICTRKMHSYLHAHVQLVWCPSLTPPPEGLVLLVLLGFFLATLECLIFSGFFFHHSLRSFES